MSVQFYNSIIEDERKMFHIKEETLKIAARQVAKTYSKSALKEGSTFLDYNIPQNRCAYLFKYASLHTDLVSKHFKHMINQDSVKFILEQKKNLKICCLGGGPGTDVVGLFKALATLPMCHQKVSEVTVLDLCGGWRNSFKHVISRLKHGKVDGVPAKFVDSNNFKASLIAVDLLGKLPDNASKVISTADIVCMVKFVSAILGKPECGNALKTIGEKLKFGCLVLFIDNFQGKVFESLQGISRHIGLITILGPLHVGFIRPGPKNFKKNPYGCPALISTRVSVIGSIKTSVPASLHEITTNLTLDICPEINSNDENDDNWNTDNEGEGMCSDLILSNIVKNKRKRQQRKIKKNNEQITKVSCDKFPRCPAQFNTRVSVIGPIKTSVPASLQEVTTNLTLDISPEINSNDENWNTDNEGEGMCSDVLLSNIVKNKRRRRQRRKMKKNSEQIPTISCDKFTQTQFKKCQIETNDLSNEVAELPDLISALSDLLNVTMKLKQRNKNRQCCEYEKKQCMQNSVLCDKSHINYTSKRSYY